jgi:hypothetical protein
MSDLATLRGLVERKLWDETNAVWSDDVIDQAIWEALDEYSRMLPLAAEEVLTLAAAGRSIDVSSITGLLSVTRVYWPYDSSEEIWPPNQVKGFRLDWVAGDPYLVLTAYDGTEPQTGDEVKVWYTCRQTIEDLDLATGTTVPALHESLIVLGAAGYAVQGRGLDLLRISEIDPDLVTKYEKWAEGWLQEFRAKLEQLRGESARAGESWGTGWELDKWEGK